MTGWGETKNWNRECRAWKTRKIFFFFNNENLNMNHVYMHIRLRLVFWLSLDPEMNIYFPASDLKYLFYV